jgi:HEAT repeat protein
LKPDDEARKRRELVCTLGLTGIAAISAIAETLHEDDVEVRPEAVWALGRIGSAAVIPTLQRALHDEDLKVRGLAAGFLRTVRRTASPRRWSPRKP